MASIAFLDVIKQNVKVVTKSKHTKSILLILAVYAFKEIIETKKFYSCPATGHRVYGAFFLFGPGVCLSLLALLLNASFWTSVTGCYRGNVDCAKVSKKATQMLLRSAFVALVWLVLAFANTKFYACFRIGAEPHNATQDVKEKFIEVKARSTMLCYGMIFAAACFALVLIVIRRCCSDRKECFPSVRKYEKLELKAAVETFRIEMEVLAKQEGEAQVELCLSRGKKEGKQTHVVIKEAREFLETKYFQ